MKWNEIYTVWVEPKLAIADPTEDSAKKLINQILLDWSHSQKRTKTLVVRFKDYPGLYDDSGSRDILGVYQSEKELSLIDIFNETAKIFLGVDELSDDLREFISRGLQ